MTNSVLVPPAGPIVLIVPPGGGKSSFAAQLVCLGTVEASAVVSADAIATELFVRHDPGMIR
jgi:hypothetical protein